MSSCLAVPSDRPKSQALQVAALRALVSCGEQGQLHAADVCRLAAQGDDRTPGVELGVSENVVYPIVPNGFADHYPY